MEYIKKEELIEGEIYKANNESLTFIMKATKDLYDVINIPSYNEFMKSGNFNGSYLTFINATSEEKHWLNTCIEQNKFITFEKAMKTFIPEYVECIKQPIGSKYELEIIYKVSNIGRIENNNSWAFYKYNQDRFKPSTKEAYDAQFVVKEPEFVLPEKWYIKTTEETFDIIRNWAIQQANFPNYKEYVHHLKVSFNYNGKYREIMNCAEITFEQFKKYVLKEEIVEKIIEPLPQFKVIESIETITKVENNEGNQFFIGDVVKTEAGLHFKITGFKYDENKTKILAIATDNYPEVVKDINDIEHYIEPKVEVEETLLEKAKRLYPIGTIVKSVSFNDVRTIGTDIFKERNHEYSGKIIYADNGGISIYSEKENHWATIIE